MNIETPDENHSTVFELGGPSPTIVIITVILTLLFAMATYNMKIPLV